jgi:hypothetical protein
MKLLNAGVILMLCFSLFACGEKNYLKAASTAHSGIHFNNEIVENDSINELIVKTFITAEV